MRTVKNYLTLLKLILNLPFNKLKGNKISFSAKLNGGILNRSSVGLHTYIGPNTVINSALIGNYTSIAPGVQIGGMEHAINWYSTSTVLSNRGTSSVKTEIGNNVWIAANAIIRKGVKIGDGAVVGACAFVNKDVPPNVIVVGSPARIIKQRLSDEMLDKISSENFWNKSPQEINAIIGR